MWLDDAEAAALKAASFLGALLSAVPDNFQRLSFSLFFFVSGKLVQIPTALEIQPEFHGCGKYPTQARRGSRSDGGLSIDDHARGFPGKSDMAREFRNRELQRTEIKSPDERSRMRGIMRSVDFFHRNASLLGWKRTPIAKWDYYNKDVKSQGF